MALLEIPDDFGQGGANIGDGDIRLVDILKNHSEEIADLESGSVDAVARAAAAAAAAAAATAQTTANGAVTVNGTQNTAISAAAAAAAAAQSDADAAQSTADGAVTVNGTQDTAIALKAPIASPVFTGTVHAPIDGAGPTFAWAGNGGEYGLRYNSGTNVIEVWRAGTIILVFDFQNITIQGPGNLNINGDTAFARDGGGFARIDNTLGVKVVGGQSEWNHAIPASQPVGGALTAGALYTANEQSMIQIMWDALQGKGTIS